MSLLLDALRRAGAARGEGFGEPGNQRPGADGGAAGHAAADEFDLDVDAATMVEPGSPSSGTAGAGLNGPARAEAVFRGGASGGSVIRTAALFALGTFALLGSLLGGGWYYYESTRSAVDRELVRYTPDPGTANDRSAEAETATAGADPSADEALGPDARDALDTATAAPEPADTAASGPSGTADTGDQAVAAVAPQSGSAERGAATASREGSAAATDGATAGDAGTAASAASADDAPASGSASAEAAARNGARDSAASEGSRTTSASTANGTASDDVRSEAASDGPMVRSTGSGDGRSPLAKALQDGYRALRSGDLMAARRHYRRAVELDPANRDARLGAAAVAQRQGNAAAAIDHYRRVLADHPRDPYARSGLASLQSTADPRRIESELKTLLKQDPDAHALRYALGNLYARENRWSQAQSAYFEAFRAAPKEADYAFNLAVALDHLGQREAAVAYYGRALELAGDGSASFPLESARRRLESLRQ